MGGVSEWVRRRLTAQRLVASDLARPEDVVRGLGALQAQDYYSARWAVGARLARPATDEEIERALAEGRVLRMHALRGTWQLLAPGDAGWIVSLVAPAVLEAWRRRLRELEIDAGTLGKSDAALVRAIERRGPLTRDELGEALKRAGIDPAGQRLPHLLGHAELQGLLCGGPRRGRQPRWRLLEVRARRSGEDALAELARRFFTSRGPAAVEDFAWWSGLRMAQAREGLEAVRGELEHERVDGREQWFDGRIEPAEVRPRAHLLPAFDEYLVGYAARGRDLVLDPARKGPVNAGGGIIGMCVVLDGRVVGTWRRTLSVKRVDVQLQLFEPITRTQQREIDAAMERYAAFLQLERGEGNVGSSRG